MVQLFHLPATLVQAVQVLDVIEMSDGECILYKTINGEMKIVYTPGDHWKRLVAATPDDLMTPRVFPRWIQARGGRDSEFQFDWLYTSDEFDALPRSLRYRELDEVNGYFTLKAAHLVPDSICGPMELYYHQAF